MFDLFEAADIEDSEVKRATEIMKLAINSLKSEMVALTIPLNIFELKAVREFVEICTDGLTIFFNAEQVLKSYRFQGLSCIRQSVAHIVLHGVLGHFEIWDEYGKKNLISTIMDIQVTKLMRFSENGRMLYDDEEEEVLGGYGLEFYYKAQQSKEYFRKVRRMKARVKSDNHETWMRKRRKGGNGSEHGGGANAGDRTNGGNGTKAGGGTKSSDGTKSGDGKSTAEKRAEMKATWRGVREDMFGEGAVKTTNLHSGDAWAKVVMQSWGAESGGSSQTITSIKQSHNDYRELLARITNFHERAKEEDNIDFAIYQYGLSLYGDVPLIEPLECVERKQLDNLVIAIDTSGSCEGEILEKFIYETAEILQEFGAEVLFEGIYLIQCDCAIQKEDCYESVFQMEAAMSNGFCVYGLGGTDFRPVFKRVEELEAEGKGINALLYFSDGEGWFPKEKPDYPVYYLMPEDSDVEFVPEWVNVITMDEEV